MKRVRFPLAALAALTLSSCLASSSVGTGGDGESDAAPREALPFTGNEAVADAVLLDALEPCEQRNLELSLCLLAAYYDRGYIAVKVEETGQASPSYSITEGRPFRIGKISTVDSATGQRDAVGDPDAIRALMEFSTGEYFNRTKVGNFVVALSRRFQDAGYTNVNITPTTKTDLSRETVDLTFSIDRGKRSESP